MEKIRLMVVDDNKEFCLLVREYAAMVDEVDFCGAAYDGISALTLIKERQPDVIILDNIMPQLDGIGVLMRLRGFEEHLKPKVVAITAAPSSTYVSETNRLGADYIISRNMDIDEIIDRCILVVRNSPKTMVPLNVDLESMVTSNLNQIGMPENIIGYQYVRTSIIMITENPDWLHSVTARLYPKVAEIHNTTPSKVERNIRNAIEIAWNKGDRHVFEQLFNTKPTNSKFIAKVADKLRLEMKNNNIIK